MDNGLGVARVARRWGLGALLVALALAAAPLRAQDKPNLAPGFTGLAAEGKVLIAPIDVELFVISGGGTVEPRADWTEAAQAHMKQALQARAQALGLGSEHMPAEQADAFGEVLALNGAVSRAIGMHHFGMLKLPTKDGRLDWSFGDTLKPLQAATGARYALFTWVRDSYASAERKAVMVGMALLGVGLSGGVQLGYASVVDLDSGRVLWFNQLARGSGDLREPAAAQETVAALLAGFPARAAP